MKDSNLRGYETNPTFTENSTPNGEDSDAAAHQSSTPLSKGCAGQEPCTEESGRNDHDAVGNPVVTDGGTYEPVDATPGQTPTADVVDAELTKFQVRILAVLAEEARYGLAIKCALEEYYGEAVNHGRLYPNLDTLVDKDFVEKSELDKRTNEYELTDEGAQALGEEIHWLADHFGLDLSEEGGDD